MAKRATKSTTRNVKQELIDGLNKDLNLELEAVLRYLYHSASATGLLGHELREELKGDIAGEMDHAVFLADKIAAQRKSGESSTSTRRCQRKSGPPER